MSIHETHKSRFLLILKINIVAFLAELAVAFYSGSLTMLSDSFHLALHIFTPLIAYISEFEFFGLSGERIKKWTAGSNILLFFFLAGLIVNEAWERLSQPPELKLGHIFFVVAVVGLAANIYNARLLGTIEDRECHVNIKPLFWHMVFDSIGSVIVIIGAMVMYPTGWFIIDPILSFVLSGLIVLGAFFMLKELLYGHKH